MMNCYVIIIAIHMFRKKVYLVRGLRAGGGVGGLEGWRGYGRVRI